MAVTRSVLRDQIKDVIVERILDGAYGPGDRIVEIRVAEELGVSQAPVREVTAAELAEIYPVRAALEEVAARAATPALAGDIAPLRTALKAMRKAAKRGDVHEFVAHDVAFHRAIVEASGNGTLQELWRSLHVDLRTTITLIKRAEDLAAVAESHVPVLEAIASGDAERAASVLRGHIEAFANWVPTPGREA